MEANCSADGTEYFTYHLKSENKASAIFCIHSLILFKIFSNGSLGTAQQLPLLWLLRQEELHSMIIIWDMSSRALIKCIYMYIHFELKLQQSFWASLNECFESRVSPDIFFELWISCGSLCLYFFQSFTISRQARLTVSSHILNPWRRNISFGSRKNKLSSMVTIFSLWVQFPSFWRKLWCSYWLW